MTENVDEKSKDMEKSVTNDQKTISKTATIPPKDVGNKSTPAKTTSKDKIQKIQQKIENLSGILHCHQNKKKNFKNHKAIVNKGNYIVLRFEKLGRKSSF